LIALGDNQERDDLIELVRGYLAPYQPADYELRVDPSGIVQDADWYYVVVTPSKDGVRSNDYVSRLVEAELDIQEKGKRNILLVPALPE